MRLLYYKNHSIMRKGVERAFEKLGYTVDTVHATRTDGKEWSEGEELALALRKQINSAPCDAAFSLGFNPQVSRVCAEKGIRYISWNSDSPLYIPDEDELRRDCNQIYIFDRGYLGEYREKGYPVRYIPLAVDTELFSRAIRPELLSRYETDAAMVGSLYFTDYEQVTRPLTTETKALLERMINTQQKIPGPSILSELLTEGFIAELNRQYRQAGVDLTVDTPALEYLMLSELTGRERRLIPSLLAKHWQVRVYSQSDFQLPHVDMRDPVDYWTQMPAIFRYSRVNINVTLRAIRTGIPLRVLDVLGCGGFLITNPQEEILEHFASGVDLVVYQSIEELYDKADWYLRHEEERLAVAAAGYERVKRDFTFEEAIRRMIEQ